MTTADEARWDARWAQASPGDVAPPAAFGDAVECLPNSGLAIDVACGDGAHAWWLAGRGLSVTGYDVSSIAIATARSRQGAGDPPHFEVVDLDLGLPPGPQVDLILCHRFSDERLDAAMVQRLGLDGVLAVAVLSEVGAGPGRFRARAGELDERFARFDDLEVIARGEGDGDAWIIATRHAIPPTH